MEKEQPYKRECEHREECHWKVCPECREYLVRSGFDEEYEKENNRKIKEVECPCYANGRICDRHLERDCPGRLQVLPSKKKETMLVDAHHPKVSEKLNRIDREAIENNTEEIISERNDLINELIVDVSSCIKECIIRPEPYLWMLDLLKSKKK